MEIAVPAGFTLTGYDIRTDSLEEYEKLLAVAHDPFVTSRDVVGRPDKDGIAESERRFFYHPEGEEKLTIWVTGPPKRVKVTVEDV